MINLTQARQLLESDYLPICMRSIGRPVQLVDDDTEEHEWGWIFYCQEVPSSESVDYYAPVLVDRVTGLVLPAGTGGVVFAIARLLELRSENLSNK